MEVLERVLAHRSLGALLPALAVLTLAVLVALWVDGAVAVVGQSSRALANLVSVGEVVFCVVFTLLYRAERSGQ